MSKAVIKNGRYTIEPLYQWDLNQVLQIYGLSLSRVPEVHFSSVALESALVRQCTMDGTGVITVNIPNSLLQKPYPIKAHVCIYEGKTFESLYTIDIPVKPRKMPADYSLENDEELYSFKELSNRLSQVETELGLDESESFYKYEYKSDNLVESKVSTTRRLFIPIISSSLKAIKSFLDKLATTLTSLITKVDTALSIAKGRNQARVFATTDDMKAWLSNEENANKCNVGDNLYIVDTEVPDWWISEVLTTVDFETGYYYKIAKLETQKVDLTTINTAIENLTTPVTLWTNPNVIPGEIVSGDYSFSATTLEMDLTDYKHFKVIFVDGTGSYPAGSTSFSGITTEKIISLKNVFYIIFETSVQNSNNMRSLKITDNGVIFNNNGYGNNYIVPYQIIGYKA